MRTVSINSGFRRGGSLLSWDGKQFSEVQRASENTWVGNGDSSFTIQVPNDFKGAVTRFWGISPISTCNSTELMGFSEDELNAPSPVKGWASCQGSCVRASDEWRLDNMEHYLIALARSASIFTVEQAMEKGKQHPSGNGKVLVHLGLEAGDQAADAFAVLDKDGNILDEVSGCGDGTPEPVITDDGWRFTSDEKEKWQEQEDAQERLFAAADAGKTPKWADVQVHLRASYRVGCNPLPTLRKKYPGTWTYYAAWKAPGDAAANEVRFSQRPFETGSWSSAWGGWQVSYVPAKRD